MLRTSQMALVIFVVSNFGFEDRNLVLIAQILLNDYLSISLSTQMPSLGQPGLPQEAYKLDTWFVEFGTKAHHSLA